MSNVSSDTSATAEKKRLYDWNIFSAVVVLLLSFILLPIIAKITLSLVPSVLGWDTAHAEAWLAAPVAMFYYVLLAESLTLGTLFFFVRRKKASFKKAIAFRPPKWEDLGLTIAGVGAYVALFFLAYTTVNTVVPLDSGPEQAIGFERSVQGSGLIFAFVSLVILPPIAEEILFRGFFFSTLRAHKVRLAWSMTVTSLIFASLHLFGGKGGELLWLAFLDTFVLSLVLCYLREKTGSIWASIGLHALKNGFVFWNLFFLAH